VGEKTKVHEQQEEEKKMEGIETNPWPISE
jgi:hypothetical protein